MKSKISGGLCTVCVGKVSILGSAPQVTGAADEVKLAVFGEYELLEEAGRGSMGVVYKARQKNLNRIVALKMILSGQFATDSERQRFKTEAEAAARLDHPGILPIHEFGEIDGRLYYVMRWLEGGTLEVGMGQEKAAVLISKVAHAVHYAHQRGVLHRDIKPGNVLIDNAGEPFIADFGLARRLGESSSATITGSVLGTPSYMSPEQAAGERSLTIGADVWGLGAVLYHLLSGKPPFQGPTALDVLSQVKDGLVTPPHRWNKKIDRDLETICLKCLRKDTQDRYASAEEMAEDLERWSRNEPIAARPISGAEKLWFLMRRRPAVSALSALLIVVFLLGLIGVLSQWHRAESERETAQRRLLQLHVEKAQRAVESGDPMSTLSWMASALASESPDSPRAQSYRHFLANTLAECVLPEEMWFYSHGVRNIEFSHDGRYLAIANNDADLMVARLDERERVLDTKRVAGGGKLIAFSPDNNRIYNSADGSVTLGKTNEGKLRVFSLPGLESLPDLMVQSKVKALALSANGALIATASEDGTVQVRRTTNGDMICKPLAHGGGLITAEFNHDASRLVTIANDNSMHLWEVPSGAERAIVTNVSFWKAHFSPDGERVLVVSRREGRAQVRDGETLVTKGPPLIHDSYLEEAIFSPDGSLIATASYDHTARIWDAKTGEPKTSPLQHANEVHCVAFSRDGKKLATGGLDPAARIWDVATGKPLTPWLHHGGEVFDVKFSPSGKHLLTCSSDGTARLWPVRQKVTESESLENQPLPIWRTTFSNDGKLAFSSSNDRGRVWSINDLKSVKPEFHVDGTIDHARFSPDGTMMLTGSRDHLVRTWRFDSDKPVANFLHNDRITAVEWLPDSKRIFSTSEEGDFALWNANNGKLLRTFSAGSKKGAFALAVSPDGRVLVGASGNLVVAWNQDTGGVLWSNQVGSTTVRELVFSPDGRLLVSGDEAGKVRILSTRSGEFTAPAIQHFAIVRQVLFSPEGGRFATVSDDLTARIWNSVTGEAVSPPMRLPDGVDAVLFSPDGRWLGGFNARSYQLWDSVNSSPISLIKAGDDYFTGARFVGNSCLMAVSTSGLVCRVDLEYLGWPGQQTVKAMEVLSGLRLEPGGDLLPYPCAGSEVPIGRREDSEATWQWLRKQLTKGFTKSP